MDEKWLYVVLLDLIIVTHSSPGRFHDFPAHEGWNRHTSWGWGHWRPEHWSGHDWPRTTQRAVKITTPETQNDGSMSPISTPPRPVIADVEMRLGETPILNTDPSVIRPDILLAKNETGQTIQPAVFTTGPQETSKIDVLDTAAVNNVTTGTVEPETATNGTESFTNGLDNGANVVPGTTNNQTGGTLNSGLDNGTVDLGTASKGKESLFTISLDNETVLPRPATNITGALFTSGLENGTDKPETANRTESLFRGFNGTVEQETATNNTDNRTEPGNASNGRGAPVSSGLENETSEVTKTNISGPLFISGLDNGTIDPETGTAATNRTGPLFISGLDNEPSELRTEPNQDALLTIGLETAVLPNDDKLRSQWHVVIYRKEAEFVDQIRVLCGGSLVKMDMVISAAHCFWSSESQELAEPEKFLVAAGKIYSQWDDRRDFKDSQYAAIKNITITPTRPPCLQPDIAFVTLATPFQYSTAVKPVCINFEEELEKRQLSKGNLGMMATWADARRLSWSSLPYVEVRVCSGSQILITRHAGRICAGEVNNTTQSEADSGNGLVFHQNGIPYLRGVATIDPEDSFCFKYNTRSFTNIGAARDKAKGPIKDIFDELSHSGCEELYRNSVNNRTSNETASQIPDHDKTEEGTEIEDSLVFSGASIGSWPVPTLPETSAPAFQWHVGVYSKVWKPYMQICGGSLVKRDVVISAAHCFWDDAAGQQPATQFAVAGGKLYRPWNDTQDAYAQHSNVSEIILPVRFRGRATSFQDDIAILRLSSPFTYAPGVQSVCVDFNTQLDREQLQAGNIGTVAGWGLTKENGRPSQRLNYLELPLLDVAECFSASDPSFLKYITSDKICAGDRSSGRALCRGDSGGGLIILSDLADTTPYLRGIASTAAANENLCNAFTVAAFTQIYAHRTFLRDNIPDIDKECADLTRKYVPDGTKHVRDVDVENKLIGTWNVMDGTRNGVDVTRNGVDGTRNGVDGTRNGVDGTKNGVDGTRNGVDGTRNGVDGTRNGVDGTRNGVDGTRNGVDGTRNGVDGTRNGVDGTRNGVDGTRNGVDGTRYGVDVTRNGVDGTRNGVDGTKNAAKPGERTTYMSEGFPGMPYGHFVCNCNCN